MKTLKDLEEESKDRLHQEPYLDSNILRQQVIKWIKEDIKKANKYQPIVCEKLMIQNLKWAERFNIVMSDLK